MGECWHLWTPEDFGIIFPDANAFKLGMNIFGVCAALFPDVTVITFELMTNHLHITAAGQESRIRALFNMIKASLSKVLHLDLSGWDCRLRRVVDLGDARNVVSYTNRNGFLADREESPFSYPWGANRFYFNREAKSRFQETGKSFSFNERRAAICSHKADGVTWLKTTDGYVSPMSFCAIVQGEALFRNASHYFYEISRNIESQRKLAAEIGERIFYTDNELFSIVVRMCKESYGETKPSLISAEAKVELAKKLHYDYNAGNKQIQRMLKMDIRNVDALFPVLVK